MTRFRQTYGDSPAHLVAVVVGMSIAGYAISRVNDLGILIAIAIWFVGMLLVHDVVLFPVYAGLDNVLARLRGGTAPRVPWVNHVRVPVVLSSFLFIAWYPLILRLARGYPRATHRSNAVFLGHWLMVTGALVAISAIVYAARLFRARRAQPAGPAATASVPGS